MIVQRTKSQFIIFIAILISSGYSYAQNIQFGKITVEDGLSNSYVNCLIQDRTGFIWFGTDDGLNRYDGYEIKVYRNNPDDSSSISDNIIWTLFEDRSGFLWIGTKGGKLNRYDPFNDTFTHWDLDSDQTEKNITFITEDSDSLIWIGTYRHGIYRFNQFQNKFDHWQNTPDDRNVLSSNFILSILEDDYSNIWIATYNGLDKFNPDSLQRPFTQIFKDSQSQSNLFKGPIWYLGKSTFNNNSLWIGKLDGLVKFNPANLEYSQIRLPVNTELQFSNSVSSVVEEDFFGEKILWIGTYGGLVRHNLTSGTNERIVQSEINPSGLLSSTIHDLIIDKSGVIWIATDNGVNYYSPKRSKFNFQFSLTDSFAELQNLQNKNIRAIARIKDLLWFGTEKGLFGFDNGTGNAFISQNKELQSLNIWSLFGGNSDNLWIGTYGQGLKELDIKTNWLKSWDVENPAFNPSAYNYVKTILLDDSGTLWIGFWGGGLARLNPSNKNIVHWRNETDNPSSLSFNDVWAIFQDSKGRIWIGTNGGGLNLFNSSVQNTFIHFKNIKNDELSLSSNNIYTICESITGNKLKDQTILWIGTANGLNKFTIKNVPESQNDSELNVEISYYTVDDGLHDNSVESILEDENGNLWIGTSSGISFFNVEDETFTNFGLADGLNGSSFNSSASVKTKENMLLFGSITGLNYCDPERTQQSTYSPPVVITDFQIFNQPVNSLNKSTFKQSIVFTKKIFLSYNQNDFSFEFTSLDYNAPELNLYAYMLEGFDEEWIISGNRRFVTYTNLDPGEYIFRVKATNSDGLWNEDGTMVAIIINPPFWATWWAYTFYFISLIGVLYFIRYTELKRRKRKEEEKLRREREEARLREAELKAINVDQEKEIEKQKIRNRIAQDLHDEIGSNLSSISLMSELIQNDEKINQEASEKIKRIHKVAKGSTQAIRDIVWLTNPSSDSLKDLISKMKEVADNTLGKFNLKFDYPKDVSEINLLPETKRNIFFIYKEALNNIIKHAEAKSVDIKFNIVNGSIHLAIKDDGKGFSSAVSGSGNGLKNIKSRAKEINAELKFESSPGKGTLLELNANITQVRD